MASCDLRHRKAYQNSHPSKAGEELLDPPQTCFASGAAGPFISRRALSSCFPVGFLTISFLIAMPFG
jgi:hypothetical protein